MLFGRTMVLELNVALCGRRIGVDSAVLQVGMRAGEASTAAEAMNGDAGKDEEGEVKDPAWSLVSMVYPHSQAHLVPMQLTAVNTERCWPQSRWPQCGRCPVDRVYYMC